MTELEAIIRSKTRLISTIRDKSELTSTIRSKTKLIAPIRGIVDTPLFQTAVIDTTGLILTLTYNKALNESIAPDAIDYTLSGTSSGVLSLIVSGLTVIITLDATVFSDETVLLDYTAGANPLQDLAGNKAANLINKVTVNNSEVGQYPVKLDDARLWVDYLNPDNISDGAGAVSNFKDKNAEDNDILQAIGAKQPILNANGILFDGIQQFIKTLPFTLVQPIQIYLIVVQVSWIFARYMFHGNINLSSAVFQNPSTPEIKAHAGVGISSPDLTIGNYGILRITFNSTSSKLQINDITPITGNVGTLDMNGFTFGAKSSGDAPGNIEVKGAVIFDETFNSLPTPTEDQAIYDYLNTYYSLGL